MSLPSLRGLRCEGPYIWHKSCEFSNRLCFEALISIESFDSGGPFMIIDNVLCCRLFKCRPNR